MFSKIGKLMDRKVQLAAPDGADSINA